MKVGNQVDFPGAASLKNVFSLFGDD